MKGVSVKGLDLWLLQKLLCLFQVSGVRAIQHKSRACSASDPSHYSHNSVVPPRESFFESCNCSVILKIRPLRCCDWLRDMGWKGAHVGLIAGYPLPPFHAHEPLLSVF